MRRSLINKKEIRYFRLIWLKSQALERNIAQNFLYASEIKKN